MPPPNGVEPADDEPGLANRPAQPTVGRSRAQGLRRRLPVRHRQPEHAAIYRCRPCGSDGRRRDERAVQDRERQPAIPAIACARDGAVAASRSTASRANARGRAGRSGRSIPSRAGCCRSGGSVTATCAGPGALRSGPMGRRADRPAVRHDRRPSDVGQPRPLDAGSRSGEGAVPARAGPAGRRGLNPDPRGRGRARARSGLAAVNRTRGR